jgi:hypothetical protein
VKFNVTHPIKGCPFNSCFSLGKQIIPLLPLTL